MKRVTIVLILFLVMILAACADAGDPAETVESYIEAKTQGDMETLQNLLCSEMESVLQREAHSFDTVSGVTIEGMACEQVDQTDTVECTGIIVALYGTEESEFPLTSYRVVEEDGEWKWCGEAP